MSITIRIVYIVMSTKTCVNNKESSNGLLRRTAFIAPVAPLRAAAE
jgi:hypothetical protein